MIDCKRAFLIVVTGTALIILPSSGCDKDVLEPADRSTPMVTMVIEYTITGGFAGIHEETHIDVDGFCRFIYGPGNEADYQMSESLLDSVRWLFQRANFFNLKNVYTPSQTVMDGFYYTITSSMPERSKTVRAETEAPHPQSLNRLLELLHELNWRIRSHADVGTLRIGREHTIKAWTFTENVRLADNVGNRIIDDGSEHFDEIFRFLREISQNDVSALFWEGDFLYRITVNWGGSVEKDSFQVIRQIPVRFWPAGFGFSLDQIPEGGNGFRR